MTESIVRMMNNLVSDIQRNGYEETKLTKEENRNQKEKINDLYQETATTSLNKSNIFTVAALSSVAFTLGSALAPSNNELLRKTMLVFGEQITAQGSKIFENKYNAASTISSGKTQLEQRELDFSQDRLPKISSIIDKTQQVFDSILRETAQVTKG